MASVLLFLPAYFLKIHPKWLLPRTFMKIKVSSATTEMQKQLKHLKIKEYFQQEKHYDILPWNGPQSLQKILKCSIKGK